MVTLSHSKTPSTRLLTLDEKVSSWNSKMWNVIISPISHSYSINSRFKQNWQLRLEAGLRNQCCLINWASFETIEGVVSHCQGIPLTLLCEWGSKHVATPCIFFSSGACREVELRRGDCSPTTSSRTSFQWSSLPFSWMRVTVILRWIPCSKHDRSLGSL